jgi:hypothetical protein
MIANGASGEGILVVLDSSLSFRGILVARSYWYRG